MRIPDLDRILSAMLKTYDGISDLNLSVGHPLQVEDFGELQPVFVDPPIEALTPYQTEQIALSLMQGNRRLVYDYLTGGSCDCSVRCSHTAHRRDRLATGCTSQGPPLVGHFGSCWSCCVLLFNGASAYG